MATTGDAAADEGDDGQLQGLFAAALDSDDEREDRRQRREQRLGLTLRLDEFDLAAAVARLSDPRNAAQLRPDADAPALAHPAVARRVVRYGLAVDGADGLQRTLFATKLWNGSSLLAEFVCANAHRFVGKSVLELGAGAALPSLVAFGVGASVVVATDYPSEPLLRNLRRNFAVNFGDRADTKLDGSDDDDDNISSSQQSDFRLPDDGRVAFVRPHLWGSDAQPLLQLLGEGAARGFDVLLLAELLWNHAQHESLLASVAALLGERGEAYVAFCHHVPNAELQDLAFFDLASQPRFGLDAKRLASVTKSCLFTHGKSVEVHLYRLTRKAASAATN